MIVSVHALFSHNDKIGSKIIAKGSKHLEPSMPETSHTSVLINGRWVHEATGDGVHVRSYDLWKTEHIETGRIDLGTRDYQEIADQYRKINDKEYDYLGVFYLGICVALYWGRELPKVNKWQSNDKFFCCEVLGYLTNKDYRISCPVQILGELWREHGGTLQS